MPLYLLGLSYAGLLMFALLLQPLSAYLKLNLPFSAALIISAVVGTSLLAVAGIDLTIDPTDFHDLIFYLLLPILVFEAAFKIDAKNLFRNIVPIFLLTGPIMVVSIAFAAAVLYIGLIGDQHFSWIAAILTGILLSATDPVTIIDKLETIGAPKRLLLMLDGEGIFNDATVIVLFSMITYIITHPDISVGVSDAIAMFFAVFFGGALIGLFCGLFFLIMSRLCHGPILQAVNTIMSAFAAFYLAEIFLNVSGVMAVLVTAIVMSRMLHFDYPGEGFSFVEQLWTLKAFIADSMVFLLTGVTLSLSLFEDHLTAVVIAIVAIVIARFLSIFGFMPLLNRISAENMPRGQQFILAWGGIKGAVALALAFSIPSSLEYASTIQAITCGVVLFSIFVQAPTIHYFAHRWHLLEGGDE